MSTGTQTNYICTVQIIMTKSIYLNLFFLVFFKKKIFTVLHNEPAVSQEYYLFIPIPKFV